MGPDVESMSHWRGRSRETPGRQWEVSRAKSKAADRPRALGTMGTDSGRHVRRVSGEHRAASAMELVHDA